ncbi:ArgK/MeaB family GTPase [Solirubrobacter deserti]|uniref:ArgK protein n=1 Tax=Solirubrobacter deserti TaxID=2282478 RepID=A0ABT4RF72_9ACTN|nr:GTP-binding protein [Solirubrobacter deserti]MDA0137167.1 ArgK protein [Solirubrobacter deserti]
MGDGEARGRGAELGARLAAGDRSAAPAALNLLETRTAREGAAALVSAAGEGAGHVIGITGPPGVGKSTLLSALLHEWRSRGLAVAVLAVDPSSKRSGGALLGDRARIEHDPADRDVFIRSMAAGERLGGLAPATRAAAQALANAFDVVVIETVGVGQSETDVAEAADTVAVVVQPASGDALQFLKAGIMEVPDVLVVTKADLGAPARRAEEDLRAALGALGADAPVLTVSAIAPTQGIAALADALATHGENRDRVRVRRLGALADFVHEHGERGLRALGGRRAAVRWLAEQDESLDEPTLYGLLERRNQPNG